MRKYIEISTGIIIIGKKYVMKAFNEESDQKREYEIQKYCADNSIAPKIIGKGTKSIEGKLYWYFSMEKHDITLDDYLKKYGKLNIYDFEKLVNVVKQMHKLGVFHQDLHKENIMFDLDEDKQIKNVKIIDFGHATRYDKEIITSNNLPKNKQKQIINYEPYEGILNIGKKPPMRVNWHELEYIRQHHVNSEPKTPRQLKINQHFPKTPQKKEETKSKQ